MSNTTRDDTGDELLCFVIGPIGDKLSDAGTDAREQYELAMLTFENVIEPACQEAGILKPVRADRYAIAGEITEQVFRLLRDADVVIADLTGANPNVMYELGLRHSLGKLTLQVGERERLPFDVQSIRTVRFRRTEGGYIDAKNTLRDMLEQGLTGNYDPVTATRIWNEDGPAPAGPAPPPEPPSGPHVPGDEATARLEHAAEAREAVAGEEDEEAPGYIELLADLEDAMPRINNTLTEMHGVMEEFGHIAKRGTEDIEASDARGAGAKGRLVVAIRFAEALDDPIDKFGQHASRLRTDAAIVDRGLNYMFTVVREGAYEPSEMTQIAEGLESFVNAKAAYREAKDSLIGFRASVEGLASIARPVKMRINRLVKTVDQVLDATSGFERWGTEAEELLILLEGKASAPRSEQDPTGTA